MIEYIDIIQDLMFGDSGKAKVCAGLLKNSLRQPNQYTHCVKSNGGHNSGHSSYINDVKVITHVIPTGVLWGIKSIIGPNAVLNVQKFFEEIRDLEDLGFKNIRSLLKISNNTHIITEKHLIEDRKDNKIGTTKMGNGPCYRDKYNRTGIKASEVPELKDYLIDFYEEFYSKSYARILIEGSQGYFLDINSESYPYVTSSHCDVGGALSNGLPWNRIRNVYGIIKAYTTYVGNKAFQPAGKIYEQLQTVGKEIGASTGRKRQCNWNRLSLLKKAILVNGVNNLIINKMDVLREIGVWKIFDINEQLIDLGSEESFELFIEANVRKWEVQEVIFSDRPDRL